MPPPHPRCLPERKPAQHTSTFTGPVAGAIVHVWMETVLALSLQPGLQQFGSAHSCFACRTSATGLLSLSCAVTCGVEEPEEIHEHLRS